MRMQHAAATDRINWLLNWLRGGRKPPECNSELHKSLHILFYESIINNIFN